MVITGELEKTIERARDYVDSAAGPERSDQLPRWAGPVCLAYSGLEPPQAEFFTAAIARVGAMIGVPVEQNRRCSSLVVVVFTDQSQEVLSRIPHTSSRVLSAWNPHRRRIMKKSAVPVRWLWNAELASASGDPISRDGDSFSEQAGRGPPQFRKPYASRLKAASLAANRNMFIIVDTTRIGGVTNGALANYLSMVVLAEPDQRQPPPSPSILQLFVDGASRPAELTAWDRAYLTALYESSADTTAFLQEREVARRMARLLLKVAEE